MTNYHVRVTGATKVERDPSRPDVVVIRVELDPESEETEHIGVSNDDDMMIGIDLAHGGVVAGHWPDGEEWVDEIRVDNPLGVYTGP